MDIEESKEEKEKKVVTGNFQQEIYMNKEDVADFLNELAKELKEGNELKITTDEWELPFKIRDQVEVEIELDRGELEIEFEFDKEKTKDLSIE